MAFGIQKSRLAVLMLNYASYLEQIGSKNKFDELKMSFGTLEKKKIELNQLKKEIMTEIDSLNEDLEMTMRLINRSHEEVKNSSTPITVGKKYYALILEKSKRVDEKKIKIKELVDAI